VTGKAAEIHLDSSLHGSTVNSVVTLGKEKGTQAENLRRQIVFMILRRASNLHEHPFFRWIYLGKPEAGSFLDFPKSKPIPIIHPPSHLLNDSQQKAIESILSMHENQRLVVIRGPPGSGKTICIASAVVSYMLSASPPCVWLVARSNVAVKNMAEKLLSIGFLDFKILVSTTFHLDWCPPFLSLASSDSYLSPGTNIYTTKLSPISSNQKSSMSVTSRQRDYCRGQK